MRRSRLAIEQELRSRIQGGVYPAGSRMPSHRQLQDELLVSSVTLQRAFDRLVEQGYVAQRGTHGTYVADTLPTNTCIALVFAELVGQGAWNSHWSTIKRIGDGWKRDAVRFRSYHITNQRADTEGHHQLCRDLADGGLAGVVFVSSPHYLGNSPVLRAAIPRVLLGSSGASNRARFGCSAVESVSPDINARLLRDFAANHRRRLAVIAGRYSIARLRDECQPLLRTLGLETRPEWWLGLPVSPPAVECARDVTRLLCAGPPGQRPDCLLLMDDNLVPHATAGLLDAGRLVPQEMEVTAHANFPGPTRALVPCTRFGPDIVGQFEAAIAEVGELARGGAQRAIHIPLRIQRDHLAPEPATAGV